MFDGMNSTITRAFLKACSCCLPEELDEDITLPPTVAISLEPLLGYEDKSDGGNTNSNNTNSNNTNSNNNIIQPIRQAPQRVVDNSNRSLMEQKIAEEAAFTNRMIDDVMRSREGERLGKYEPPKKGSFASEFMLKYEYAGLAKQMNTLDSEIYAHKSEIVHIMNKLNEYVHSVRANSMNVKHSPDFERRFCEAHLLAKRFFAQARDFEERHGRLHKDAFTIDSNKGNYSYDSLLACVKKGRLASAELTESKNNIDNEFNIVSDTFRKIHAELIELNGLQEACTNQRSLGR